MNTKNRITFISQTLAFSNPRLLSSFVPATFEDVLSGLPTSEQPYNHELRRGPSRARCSRSSRVPCLHRLDRSAKPVRPVRPGFFAVLIVLTIVARSSTFECVGAILCQHNPSNPLQSSLILFDPLATEQSLNVQAH